LLNNLFLKKANPKNGLPETFLDKITEFRVDGSPNMTHPSNLALFGFNDRYYDYFG